VIFEFGKSEKSLLELIRTAAPGSIDAPCGGRGRCGKCRVRAWGELRCIESHEPLTAAGQELSACRYAPQGPCRVEIEHLQASDNLDADSSEGALGLAADIGSTTLELRLYEKQSGRELAASRQLNAQRSYGADVLSRIQALRTDREGLYSCLREQLWRMAKELCAAAGRKMQDVETLIVCGNTVMEHFAAGLDPSSIALPPFEPASRFLDWGREKNHFGGEVLYCPCLSGYVGGDLIAGLSLESEKSGLCLYMDIGTNGELALGDAEGYICCATAAGPAFEGAELSCGMGGSPGAIYRVEAQEDDISLSVIGGGEAKGICGSGVIDAVASMLELGVIGKSGRFANASRLGEKLRARLDKINGESVFMLSGDVYLSAGDIRKLQLAKAAIRAGTELLLKKSGKTAADIQRISLAGGFGSAINRQSARRIGLIPDCPGAQLCYAGNAAVMGAAAALYPQGRERIEKTLALCEYAELSTDRDFPTLYLEYLNF